MKIRRMRRRSNYITGVGFRLCGLWYIELSISRFIEDTSN